MHPLVSLAAQAIALYLEEQRLLVPAESVFVEVPEAGLPGPAFVCLKRSGTLRGCIGTTEPTQQSLALEIVHNAVAAATRDPRFPPVVRQEVAELEVTIDILGPACPISDLDELDPRRYGVLVQAGTRRGVLLPDLEGIISAWHQVSLAREKAGLGPDEAAELFRFEVTRYK